MSGNKLPWLKVLLPLLALTLTACPNPTPAVKDFDISLDPTSLTIVQGGSGNTGLTLTPKGGFTGTVDLSLVKQDGSPAPGGIALEPSSVGVSGSNPVNRTLTISVASSVEAGTYNLKLKATSGNITKEKGLTVTVQPQSQPDFDISLSPAELEITQGGSKETKLTLTPKDGFTGRVSLSLVDQDSGTTPSGIALEPTGVDVKGSDKVERTLTISVARGVQAGTYNLKLKATSGNLTKEANLSLTVSPPPDFQISLNPAELTITQGERGQTGLTLTPKNGFSGTVNLSLEGQDGSPAPSGITLSPTGLTVGGTGAVNQTLTLNVDRGVAAGSYPLRVKATGGGLTRTADFSLTVSPAPDFDISLDPTSLTIVQGGSGNTGLTLTPEGGFTGTVSLSLLKPDVGAAPGGITLEPTGVLVDGSGPTTRTLTIKVAGDVQAGTYSLKVRATNGNITKEAGLSLTVSPPPDFEISLNPAELEITQGSSKTTELTVIPKDGFTGTVDLSLVDTGGSVAQGFTLSPTRVSVEGQNPTTQTLAVRVSGSVNRGTYALKLRATSGTLTKEKSLTVTVQAPPSFTLSLSPTSLTVVQGDSGQTTLTLTPQNGFTGTVNLSLVDQYGNPAPSGITLSPTSVSVDGNNPVTQTLTIGVARDVEAKTYSLKLKATSGNITKEKGLTVTVQPQIQPDFEISLNPTSLTVVQGSSGTTQLTITPKDGFTGRVDLRLVKEDGTAMPTGIALSPTTVSVSDSNPVNRTLTISVASSVEAGTYNLKLKATSGNITKEAGLSLTVSRAPDFEISLNPTSLTINQGNSGQTTLTLTPKDGFTGQVTLSAVNPPAGFTVTFTPSLLDVPSQTGSTVTVAVDAGVPQGDHTLTLRAQGGGTSRTASLRVTVNTAPNLYIARTEWGQSVLREDLRLVGGKPALLRAYPVSTALGVSADLRGAVYQGSTFLGNLTFTCPSPLPTAPDPSRLEASCNATLPASWVVPGLEVVLTVDPEDRVPETDERDNTLTLTPTVGSGTVLYLTVVPVIHQGVEAQIPSFRDYVWSIWPLKEISYTVRAPYTTSVILDRPGDWTRLLDELKTLRQTDGSNRYYYGFVRVNPYISGVAGIALMSYPVAVGWDDPYDGPVTMAHELGHNFGLGHAPCGDPSDLDPDYPYPEGKIGTWGYNLTTGELYDPEEYYDLMSYCWPRWVSDYNYQKVQTFLEENPPSPQALSHGEYILLSGRIEGDSVRLYPPVHYTGYPVENKPGEYRLEVETSSGLKVISFAPLEDELGGLSFQVSLKEAPTALRLYRGGALLLERRASAVPLSTWQASLREEAGRVILTWEGAPYASLVYIAPDGTRTTLGLWQRGGRAEFPTGGLPAGGSFEVQLSDGLRVERYRFER